MKTTKEWEMVTEIYEIVDELESWEAQNFINELYENLDPYSHFLEQKSDRCLSWLYGLYEQYINEDYHSAQEYYDQL